MLILTKLQSKTALIFMLSIFTIHAPMQALPETEQVVAATLDFVQDHPVGVAIIAGATVLTACALADYYRVLWQIEERLYSQKQCNPQEQYVAQQAVEEAAEQVRIDEAQERYAQEKSVFEQKYAAQTDERLEEMRLLQEKKHTEWAAEFIAALERKSEELRILDENKKAEEERINALDVEEFSHYISSRISEIESSFNEIKESELMQSIREVQGLTTLLPEDVIDFYVVRAEALNTYSQVICEKLVLVQELEAYLERRMDDTLEANSILILLQEKVTILKEQKRDLLDSIRCASDNMHAHRSIGKKSISVEDLLGGLLLLARLLK